MAVEKVEEKLPYIVNDVPYVPDDVYPLHTLDYNPAYVDWVMVFNDVLDPNVLKKSLSRLLEIGDWRKMGGRFQYNVCGVSDCGCSMEEELTSNRRTANWRYSSQDLPQAPGKTYPSQTMLLIPQWPITLWLANFQSEPRAHPCIVSQTTSDPSMDEPISPNLRK